MIEVNSSCAGCCCKEPLIVQREMQVKDSIRSYLGLEKLSGLFQWIHGKRAHIFFQPTIPGP